jgi:signal transduction histidine kinase
VGVCIQQREPSAETAGSAWELGEGAMSQRDVASPNGSVGFEAEPPAPPSLAAGASQARLELDDRQRIERDIHDGVQQRLTALRVRLSMAAERFDARGEQAASATLTGFGAEVELAIEELREVAHGVYPPLLASGGLRAALAAAAIRAPHPVTVTADGIGRHAPEIESAIYFSVMAALDNAAKYAGQGPVTVAVWEANQRLHFTVTDYGDGFRVNGSPAGGGLANMRDRIAAVHGTFKVESTQSKGTRITGTVPGSSRSGTPRPPG